MLQKNKLLVRLL